MTSAETPAECGLDIDVPAIACVQVARRAVVGRRLVGCGVQPASTCTPGAVTSGLIQSPVGPRDENDAITSACAGVAVPCAQVAFTLVCGVTKAWSEPPFHCVWMAGR